MMIYKQKFTIGEFSKLMQTTVKTLRHYEQKGLLLPDKVDEWTGYRYYNIVQMQRLQSIRDLQRLGFSLEEIKDLLEDDSQTPSIRQLDEKISETERQLQQLVVRRERLLKWRDSRKQFTTMEKFSIHSLPSIIVASHRETIPNFAAIGPMCYEKIGPEMQRLGCKCPPPGYCFTVEHNKEYTPTNIDIEYCEQVEEMGIDSDIIQFKQLPEVPKALCVKFADLLCKVCKAAKCANENRALECSNARFILMSSYYSSTGGNAESSINLVKGKLFLCTYSDIIAKRTESLFS